MNESPEIIPSSDIEAQASDANAPTAPKKKKLLDEYQDNVGGGGFHAWVSWTHSV